VVSDHHGQSFQVWKSARSKGHLRFQQQYVFESSMSRGQCCFSGKGGLGGSHWASTHTQETMLLDTHQAESPDEDAVVCQELGPA
jgi:hypothetical protein